MSIQQTVPPTAEPVSLDEAKLYARVTHDAEDDLFTEMISASREQVESLLHMQLMPATWRLTMDYVATNSCGEILIPRPPLQSVSTFQYLDTSGTLQTLDSSVYKVSTDGHVGRITLNEGQTWPSTQLEADAVVITYVAGYADADAVPLRFKLAIKMLLANWNVNRQGMDAVPESIFNYLSGDIVHGIPVDHTGPTL